MNARQQFKMEYQHLRRQLGRGANRESWLREFNRRGGVSLAASAAVDAAFAKEQQRQELETRCVADAGDRF